MEPTVNQGVMYPWKAGPGFKSLCEMSWKNGVRWFVVAGLLVLGSGCISAGAKHFGEYRKLRVACQQGQVTLPSYDQATSSQLQPNHPPSTCLRQNSATQTVSLNCSCYSGVSWTTGCAFTAIGVLLLLFIMVALTDHCCCCFWRSQQHRDLIINPPAAVVVGIPAAMSPMGTGYSAYPVAQLPRAASLGMRATYPMQGAMQMAHYNHGQYPMHDHAHSQEMYVIPVSTHASHAPSDMQLAMGMPASPPPTKSSLPYRSVV